MAQFQSGPVPVSMQPNPAYDLYSRAPYDPYMAPPPQDMSRLQCPPSSQAPNGPYPAYNLPSQQPAYGPPSMYTNAWPPQNYGCTHQRHQSADSSAYGPSQPAGMQYPLGEPVPQVSRELHPHFADERRPRRSKSAASRRSHKSTASRKSQDSREGRRHRRHRSVGSSRPSFSSDSTDEDSDSGRGAPRRSRQSRRQRPAEADRLDDSRPNMGGSLLNLGRSLKTIVTGNDYGSDY